VRFVDSLEQLCFGRGKNSLQWHFKSLKERTKGNWDPSIRLRETNPACWGGIEKKKKTLARHLRIAIPELQPAEYGSVPSGAPFPCLPSASFAEAAMGN
jgi:hypothetical protein